MNIILNIILIKYQLEFGYMVVNITLCSKKSPFMFMLYNFTKNSLKFAVDVCG